MISKIKISLLVICLSVTFNTSFAEGLTKQQGDAILQELQKIRVLLQQNNAAKLKQVPAEAAVARVSAKGGVIIGNAKAPITLVEYTDYECSYCYKFFRDTYPQLKKKYIDTGKMRLIVKDLPLNFHPHARKASQAARCANDQGEFLAMHEHLHKNSKRLAEKHLSQYAKEISLDVNVFKSCLASNRHLDEIDKESEEAQRAGIAGTPTFVLGKTNKDVIVGTRIVGAKPMVVFERHIGELIARLIASSKKVAIQ